MIISGFQKSSFIDYPGKICAVVFTQGCNFRCPFCHNPELLDFKSSAGFDINYITSFLEKRRGFLQAVTITGGEPTLQPGLIEFIKMVKDKGYAVKLDTNGSCPEILDKLIRLRIVDFMAMDIKAPQKKYPLLAGEAVSFEKIMKSVRLIEKSGMKYQLRTTYVRPLLNTGDLVEIASMLADVSNYRIQPFIYSDKILDPSLARANQFNEHQIVSLQKKMNPPPCRSAAVPMRLIRTTP